MVQKWVDQGRQPSSVRVGGLPKAKQPYHLDPRCIQLSGCFGSVNLPFWYEHFHRITATFPVRPDKLFVLCAWFVLSRQTLIPSTRRCSILTSLYREARQWRLLDLRCAPTRRCRAPSARVTHCRDKPYKHEALFLEHE